MESSTQLKFKAVDFLEDLHYPGIVLSTRNRYKDDKNRVPPFTSSGQIMGENRMLKGQNLEEKRKRLKLHESFVRHERKKRSQHRKLRRPRLREPG